MTVGISNPKKGRGKPNFVVGVRLGLGWVEVYLGGVGESVAIWTEVAFKAVDAHQPACSVAKRGTTYNSINGETRCKALDISSCSTEYRGSAQTLPMNVPR